MEYYNFIQIYLKYKKTTSHKHFHWTTITRKMIKPLSKIHLHTMASIRGIRGEYVHSLKNNSG